MYTYEAALHALFYVYLMLGLIMLRPRILIIYSYFQQCRIPYCITELHKYDDSVCMDMVGLGGKESSVEEKMKCNSANLFELI